ncbi:reverse transcriptase [Phytophthora cinnamomi]|uniref:reverse transcriptase n=1 Tax=Phytophthora cinnamomi TaxID=4785 RepID=UPI003559FB44|nr:reverse transcriptase [Phytophthora cinnamomi]
MPRLDFEEVDTPRSLLEVRLATGAIVKTEKRVVNVRFSYKQRVFVEHFVVLDQDDKFDVVVMGMPCKPRHDPVIDWKKRTLVRFGRNCETESDGPVAAAHAPAGAHDSPVETALNAAVRVPKKCARARTSETNVGNAADVRRKKMYWFQEPIPTFKRVGTVPDPKWSGRRRRVDSGSRRTLGDEGLRQ